MDSTNEAIPLSEKQWEWITAYWDWNIELPANYEMLYHYYKGRRIIDILKKDRIVFRLAAANTFPDKLEGRAVEVYYDLTLEELVNEHKISAEQYDRLSKITVPKKTSFFLPGNNGIDIYREEEFEEYIICFSLEKDDPNMFKTYTSDSDGYCLHLFGIEIQELKTISIRNHAEIKLIPVLYGRQVIEFLKEKVYDVVSNKVREERLEDFISDLLHYTQFAAKRKKYSYEKEVRLVVYLPKDLQSTLPDFKPYCDISGKKYVFLSVPKYLLYDISPGPQNTDYENREMKALLEENEYFGTLEIEGMN